MKQLTVTLDIMPIDIVVILQVFHDFVQAHSANHYRVIVWCVGGIDLRDENIKADAFREHASNRQVDQAHAHFVVVIAVLLCVEDCLLAELG